MSTVGQIIYTAADTLPYWRDAAMAGLASIVIGCLWLYASVVGES